MWVWQSGRVNSWLAGCLPGGWLVWCCCLVVETGSWCWFFPMSKCSECKYPMSKVKISNVNLSEWDSSCSVDPWKSRVADSCLDLWAVQGPLRCAALLIFAGRLPWVSLWVWGGCDSWQMRIWLSVQLWMVLLGQFEHILIQSLHN